MFFGSNNNSNDSVNTNTTIITMYSDLSSLTIGAWNDKINLKFNPSIGKDGNGLNQYDRDKRASTALTQTNACALLANIKTVILPKYQSGEDIGDGINVAVSMGRADAKNILRVEYKPYEGKNRFLLTLAQGVSDNGTVSDDNKISYLFNQVETMTNYNSSTGSGDLSIDEAEFFNFVDILKRRTDILPNIAHSIRHSKEIGKRYSNNGGGNNFNNNSSSSNTDFLSAMNDEGLPFN